jgi:hypothetical protein
MFRLPKTLFSFLAVALAAAVLLLTAPRAAHAIAAALVQVTNTAASPAITQGTEKQAAQILELYCFAFSSGTGNTCLQSLPAGGTATYTPGADSYVITGVDLLPRTPGGLGCGDASNVIDVTLSANGNARYQWGISGPTGLHFTYPSGIVTPPGATLVVSISNGGGCVLPAYLHGYLTAN